MTWEIEIYYCNAMFCYLFIESEICVQVDMSRDLHQLIGNSQMRIFHWICTVVKGQTAYVDILHEQARDTRQTFIYYQVRTENYNI
jgi:hypothetical protein